MAADGDAAQIYSKEGDDDDGDDRGHDQNTALDPAADGRAPDTALAARSLGWRLISGRDLGHGISLLNNHKKPANLDGLTITDAHFLDPSVLGGCDLVLHLHRLHHHEALTRGDFITGLDEYPQHAARHGRQHTVLARCGHGSAAATAEPPGIDQRRDVGPG